MDYPAVSKSESLEYGKLDADMSCSDNHYSRLFADLLCLRQ